MPGTREVTTIGGPGRAVLRRDRPGAHGRRRRRPWPTCARRCSRPTSALPVGELLGGNRAVALEAGPFLRDARDVGELVVGVRDGKPVFLQDVAARARRRRCRPQRYVWHGVAGRRRRRGEFPAVTHRRHQEAGRERDRRGRRGDARASTTLRNTVIPHGVEVAETRNYGATANDKANKLIQKLLFATASVVALVFLALGRREAAIVGSAVILTLTVTLFASWAWGFTLNRVSLFALIFSIGILVDDAIVVVENIHRHQALHPGQAAGASSSPARSTRSAARPSWPR